MVYDNQTMTQEKTKLIDYRIAITVAFIMSITVSIILLYNKKLVVLNKEPLFNKKETKMINTINASIVLGIVLFIQYINYKNKEIIGFEGKSIGPINTDITASYFLIIASIISLYSSYISPVEEEEPAPLT